ncbi:hypothetical protein [Halalkalicoccus ordinarius]|uniref:hypothetical protein n=1 Tax=Halalkalicoccus ordinarius TaxID=3116651 RepID=UPI00300F0A87
MAPTIPTPVENLGFRLLKSNPLINRAIRSVYERCMWVFVVTTAWWQYREYSAVPDPLEPTWVDPQRIDSLITHGNQPLFGCYVKGGNWDRNTEDLEEYYGYRSFVQHFDHGIDWEDTEAYAIAEERINEDEYRGIWGYTDLNEFERSLEKTDQLYTDLQEHGYRSQRELADQNGRIENIGGLPVGIDEVRVAIGRDGEVIFLDGRHRFFCARIIELDEIPVRIVVRHADWQAYRDAVFTGEVEDENHPDLRGL